MGLDLRPEQPLEVARAVEMLLAAGPAAPDSWWREGIEEALYGEATALPRSTFGADLA
jgi:hypothetical protein